MKYILVALALLLVGCGNHNKQPKCISTGGSAFAYVDENSTESNYWFEEVKCLTEAEILSRRK
jgi:hypothetical protein